MRPGLWEHHLAFDDDNRVYASLYRDAHVDVWLLCWTPENDTGFHDHDISSGAVAVVSGTLLEHNLAIDGQTIETPVEGGHVFSFGPDHIHRLTGAVHGSVSVHAYSPPCGGWVSTPSAPTADCAGGRSRTPTSFGRSTEGVDAAVWRLPSRGRTP